MLSLNTKKWLSEKIKDATLLTKGIYDKTLHFIAPYPLCALVTLTAMTLCIAGTGLSPATAADREEGIATTAVENSTVISEAETGSVGLTLPGTLTDQPQLSLAEVPEEYLETAEENPIVSTKLAHGAISSYQTDTGTQTFIRIDSPAAAKEYRFPLTLPEGAAAELNGDGSVLIKDAHREVLGGYKSPWAVDVNNAHIPTRFRLEGHTLIQTIDFTPATTFPIIADPNGFWGWAHCAGAIGTAIATNGFLALRIAKVGGIARAIALLKNAKTKVQLLEAGKYIFGEVTGISGIMTKCILS